MPRARPVLRPGEICLVLTSDQARDFAACAAACGLSTERWIVECAAVHAAAAIDALQAEDRRRRLGRGSDNAALNAKHREQRKRRRDRVAKEQGQ